MRSSICSKSLAYWALLILVAACAAEWTGTSKLVQAADPVPVPVEFLWQSDPQLDFSWFLPVQLASLHIDSPQFSASSATERMRAAQAIVRVPNSPTLERPTLLLAIIERLDQGESEVAVRAELIAAACELDDGQFAPVLWRIARGDRLNQPVVESACARWRATEPLATWRERLQDRQASDFQLQLAIAGVAATGVEEDVELLKAIALDATVHSPARLAAAKAIGHLSQQDQSGLAEQLRSSRFEYPDHLAMLVLKNSPVAAVTPYAQQLAQSGSPPAQRAAYQWLCEHDPAVAQATANDRLRHADSQIRTLALEQIADLNNEQTLTALQGGLNDVHPEVRDRARRLILSYVARSPEHRQRVEAALGAMLAHADWRCIEQTIRLTVELEQSETVPQLLTLLEHPRPEVCITAGWALRHLATEEASLQAILEHLTRWTERRLDPNGAGGVGEADLRRMAHLFEALGRRRYEPAKPLALRYVPKQPVLGIITRMTAIWACGQLWEFEQNKELTDELERRIADKSSMFPEAASVRFAATLALGFVADPETRNSLVQWNEGQPSPIFYATEWALKRIDVRQPPPPR